MALAMALAVAMALAMALAVAMALAMAVAMAVAMAMAMALAMAVAMEGLIAASSHPESMGDPDPFDTAKRAAIYADKLLAELAKEKT